MQSIERITAAEAEGLVGLLFDLDDTVLDHGALTEPAYSALFRLREAGLFRIAVTGRPASWGELLIRQWPIDAIVTENGAIAHVLEAGRVTVRDRVPPAERARRRARVHEIVAILSKRFADLEPADDVGGRISDFTFDIGEHRRVPRETVERAIDAIRSLGARSFASSVHLHVTLDADDKATGTLRLLRERFGEEPTRARARFAFIGDSENDAACFGAFRTTIGVANFRGRPTLTPRFVTRGERGAGFAEAVRILCERRTGQR